MNDTRNLVEHSTELITGQKVRFAVVNQTTWQPALIENESFGSELVEKLDKIDEKLHSKKGEIVLVFTREMPKNVYEEHYVRSANSANYLMLNYPDYLDKYQSNEEREKSFRYYGFYFVNSELRQIAIYAVNR